MPQHWRRSLADYVTILSESADGWAHCSASCINPSHTAVVAAVIGRCELLDIKLEQAEGVRGTAEIALGAFRLVIVNMIMGKSRRSHLRLATSLP